MNQKRHLHDCPGAGVFSGSFEPFVLIIVSEELWER